MKNVFHRLKLKQDLDRIEILQWGHLAFFLLAILLEFFNGHIGFWIIPKLAIMAFFYRLFYRFIQGLFYSFWTFAILLSIYFIQAVNHSFNTDQSAGITICYLAALTILFIEIYIISSPIYYPFVSWWEYDFRFRDDLKIKVKHKDNDMNGRLVDLRREAGGLALFEEFHVGEILEINLKDSVDITTLKAEIMSRRQYSLGRPFTYGVRFLLSSVEEKRNYIKLIEHWKNRKRLIRKLKYSSTNNENQ